MAPQATATTIPVSWLRPLPDGYRIPLWRWILLPATALMLRHYGGVWATGMLELRADEIRFTQSKAIGRKQADAWVIPLSDISDVGFSRGRVSETILIHHGTRTTKLMAVRAGDFVQAFRAALPNA